MGKLNSEMRIVGIVAIVAIVGMVLLFSSNAKAGAPQKPYPEFKVAIDEQGNLYDGEFNLIGQLADKDMEFYDSEGNMIGFAQINLPDEAVVEPDGDNLVGDARTSSRVTK
jgi:hypothetical protein